MRRDLGTFGSIKVNNFFLFVALLVYGAAVSGVAPVSAYPFLLLLGLLLLFPLSGDPFAKIPPARLGIWPLSRRQRSGLRIATLVFSPILWMAALLSPKLRSASLCLAVPLVLQSGWKQLGKIADVSVAARGPVLLRNNLRQMLSVLDTWLAAVIALAGFGYRLLSDRPDPAAFRILAMLVALALSTYAQCLFSLDSASGATRYHLLPIRGWRILLAKDAAFLGILLILTLPLHAPAGMTFGLCALAVGRYPALTARVSAQRWRFTSGRIFFGVLQIVLGAAAAFSIALSWPFVAAGYLASILFARRTFTPSAL
jgi:hypothetical protein